MNVASRLPTPTLSLDVVPATVQRPAVCKYDFFLWRKSSLRALVDYPFLGMLMYKAEPPCEEGSALFSTLSGGVKLKLLHRALSSYASGRKSDLFQLQQTEVLSSTSTKSFPPSFMLSNSSLLTVPSTQCNGKAMSILQVENHPIFQRSSLPITFLRHAWLLGRHIHIYPRDLRQ